MRLMSASSDDFRGLADWWAAHEVDEKDGEPAYHHSFGWTPLLVPLPRRAPDDLA
ncbi:hypothetical protein GCM10010428_14120 [Actinosynnema pretiosum subsp. pretiosum]